MIHSNILTVALLSEGSIETPRSSKYYNAFAGSNVKSFRPLLVKLKEVRVVSLFLCLVHVVVEVLRELGASLRPDEAFTIAEVDKLVERPVFVIDTYARIDQTSELITPTVVTAVASGAEVERLSAHFVMAVFKAIRAVKAVVSQIP
jgi:hypothetical protein